MDVLLCSFLSAASITFNPLCVQYAIALCEWLREAKGQKMTEVATIKSLRLTSVPLYKDQGLGIFIKDFKDFKD